MTGKIFDFHSPTSPDPGDGVNRSKFNFFSRTTSTQTNNKDICTGTTYMHGSRILLSVGGGDPGSSTYFTVYRGGPMVILHIFQGGVQLFPGGGGGSNCQFL